MLVQFLKRDQHILCYLSNIDTCCNPRWVLPKVEMSKSKLSIKSLDNRSHYNKGTKTRSLILIIKVGFLSNFKEFSFHITVSKAMVPNFRSSPPEMQKKSLQNFKINSSNNINLL